jgi:tetratricopeptide (TPR) repeat protein
MFCRISSSEGAQMESSLATKRAFSMSPERHTIPNLNFVLPEGARPSVVAAVRILNPNDLRRFLRLDSQKRLFEKAVELHPFFAYVGLAECFLILPTDTYEPYEQSIPKGELAVKKALKLDPELAEAAAMLAQIHFLEDDVVASETEARRAIELNPSLPHAYRILSNLAAEEGDGDEGIRLWEAAYRLDPVRPRYVERVGSFYSTREGRVRRFSSGRRRPSWLRLEPTGT